LIGNGNNNRFNFLKKEEKNHQIRMKIYRNLLFNLQIKKNNNNKNNRKNKINKNNNRNNKKNKNNKNNKRNNKNNKNNNKNNRNKNKIKMKLKISKI